MKSVQKTVLIPYEKYLRCLQQKDTPIIQKEIEQIDENMEEEQIGQGLSMDVLLSDIPKPYLPRVKGILMYVLNDPKHTLKWNERGELQYNGKTIPDSHVLDLLKDSQHQYGGREPKGLEEFYKGLKDINIPRSLIGNQNRRRIFLDDHLGLPPGIPDRMTKKEKKKWISL